MKARLPVGSETIVVHVWHAENSKTTLVSLHGAGTSDKTRFEYQVPYLLEHGISVITFDFSGQGESSGKLDESSLEKRVQEAQAIIKKCVDSSNFSLCGSSMGGHIALKLLEQYSPHALLLFAPGVYSQEAYSVQFGGGFTDIIRKPNSWRDSDVWKLLKKYPGKLLTIIGENDEVIPPGVIQLIGGEQLIIPEAPHAIHKFLQAHSEANKIVQEKMIVFLRP